MKQQQELISFHLIERQNNTNLMIWSYPSISDKIKPYIIQKTFQIPTNIFLFYNKTTWIYILQIVDPTTAPVSLSGTAVVLLSKELNPDKYQVLCECLGKAYINTKNPSNLVGMYLDVFIRGSCLQQENGSTVARDLACLKRKSHVKELLKMFGAEVVLIYFAVLLKKRIFVYHQDVSTLQKVMVSIAEMVKIREPKSYLYPHIDNIREIENFSFFVAGIYSKKHNLKPEIYDLFVNLSAQKIIISPHAKAYFVTSKLQKDIGNYFTELIESDVPETEVVTEISKKTDEIIKQLKSISSKSENGSSIITIDNLKMKNFQPALENFFLNLASAENMMVL